MKLVAITISWILCFQGYSQNFNSENDLIIRVKAKYTAFPRGNFYSFDSYGVELYVQEILLGKIDSLTYENTIGLGYKVLKGENSPKILKDTNYYLFLRNSTVSYNPIAKIVGDLDTIDDPWIAKKDVIGTMPSYTVDDISKSIFGIKEQEYNCKGTGQKDILLNVQKGKSSILLIEFDAEKIKDKIIISSANNIVYKSDSFVSGFNKLIIPLGIVKEDLKLTIINEANKSSWKLKYKIIELLSLN